jgi:hypothetical protein
MLVIATQSHGTIFQSFREFSFTTASARARIPINAVIVVAYGHAPGSQFFFASVASENCVSVTANSNELVFSTGDGERRTTQAEKRVVVVNSITIVVVTIFGYVIHDLKITPGKVKISNKDVGTCQVCRWGFSGLVTSHVEWLILSRHLLVTAIADAKWIWNCEVTTTVWTVGLGLRR